MNDRILADMDGVEQGLRIADTFIQESRLATGLAVRLRVVCEELIRNVVLHGDPVPGSAIELELAELSEGVRIMIGDRGVAFDPRTLRLGDRAEAVMADVEGGVGWPLILAWCDIVSYEREDGVNRLHLLLRSIETRAGLAGTSHGV